MGRIYDALVGRVTGDGGASEPLILLVADDDEDDREFISSALVEVGNNVVRFVHNGQELLDFLRREGAHAGRPTRDMPDLVILDLKMPKMGGTEALSEIRADPRFMRLPVVVLTTATSEEFVNDSYDRGANSVISKPPSFRALVEVLRAVRIYWAVVRPPTSAPRFRATEWIAEVAEVPSVVELPKPKRASAWRKRSEA